MQLIFLLDLHVDFCFHSSLVEFVAAVAVVVVVVLAGGSGAVAGADFGRFGRGTRSGLRHSL